jgi:hypothetical protein
MTSKLLPPAISKQAEHAPHGFNVGPFWQLSDLAKILAQEVLPIPRGPQNKKAWAMRPDSMDFLRSSVIWA